RRSWPPASMAFRASRSACGSCSRQSCRSSTSHRSDDFGESRRIADREARAMNRRAFVTGLGAVLAAPPAADAQPAGEGPPGGWLGDDPATTHFREAFRQGLRDLGYVEDRDLRMEYRFAEGKPERFHAVAAQLSALNPDVIVAVNNLAALAAKQVTKTIPIVFVSVADPVDSGLVTSLARPGANVTGLSSISHELVGKGLELPKQAAPTVSRVAVLWQPGGRDELTQRERLQRAEVAARVLDVRLQVVEARRPADLDKAFSEIGRARAGAL